MTEKKVESRVGAAKANTVEARAGDVVPANAMSASSNFLTNFHHTWSKKLETITSKIVISK